MTQLLNMPQIPGGTVIAISSDADWTDQFYVPQAGFAAGPITLTGSLAASTAFTVASSAGVLPGMLAEGFGIPANTTVSSLTGTTITLSQAAMITAPAASISFFPPPLDLTGIALRCEVRAFAASPQVLLLCSTAAGTMTNSGASGLWGWNVPAATLRDAPWPAALASQGQISCVMDVFATDATGATVNLCAQNGPIALTVNLAITR